MKLFKVEKAVLLGLMITVIAASLSSFSVFAKQCSDIRGKVLRLHIIANSDSKADQQLKLNVRDRILRESQELFIAADNKEEAEENVREKLPEIIKIAQDEVKREGFNYKVNAQLVNMYFTTRKYDNITLPAGYYDAVRITIGEAKGHNWWCVLFPSLCIPASSEEQKQEISDVLSPDEENIVENSDKPDIKIKFKVVELFEQCDDFLKTFRDNVFSQ
ncbi:stage II sporulation protein R [[Clostridium] cellulosi]|uniref:Stage II sporulation protein R n=1 Tax=[Clostridium] cellulosi TaxID=29343 RepID=A0A078KPY3_9FIRM|nr:MAG: stage II sporulation protein R [[Clostridium] cellulosi]CDZ24483.1 stage II sporulation protein R [[Clostridium] cellulosi]